MSGLYSLRFTDYQNTSGLQRLYQGSSILFFRFCSKRSRLKIVSDPPFFDVIQCCAFSPRPFPFFLTFGFVKSKRHAIEETLDHLFKSLDENEFYRINRSQIVSRNSIQKIEPYFNHRLKILITNSLDQEFIVSRQKASDFKKWLNS